MSSHHTLSLTAAIIINLNIIIGSGIFINTTELAKRTGALGGLSYMIVGLLLFPLILSFVKLLQLYPGGSFYAFAKTAIHPAAGFMSTWIYFTTKLASATVLIHTFSLLIQEIFPLLKSFNIFLIDIIMLLFILVLNLLNVRTGSTLQALFFAIKLCPLFFVIISGLFLLQGEYLSFSHQLWAGMPAALPLVLFAMTGFEAACSVSSKIENPQVNAPRAVLISYGIVILIYGLYQSLFYGALGNTLLNTADFRGAFPLLIETVLPAYKQMPNFLEASIYIAIAASSLSSAFGIIFTNAWNMYTLAAEKHVYTAHIVTRPNRYNTPFVCIIIQGIIVLLYLLITYAHQVTLQTTAALGGTTTYLMSIIGLLATLIKKKQKIWLPLFSLINCAIFFAATFYSLWISQNKVPLYIHAFIWIFGSIMFLMTEGKNNST